MNPGLNMALLKFFETKYDERCDKSLRPLDKNLDCEQPRAVVEDVRRVVGCVSSLVSRFMITFGFCSQSKSSNSPLAVMSSRPAREPKEEW